MQTINQAFANLNMALLRSLVNFHHVKLPSCSVAHFTRNMCSSADEAYYDIIIAGGGMVGTTLACRLGQCNRLSNKSILLLESSHEKQWMLKPQYSNRVSALNPGTKQLLDDDGAWIHISELRFKPVKKMQVWDSLSDSIITFSHDTLVDDIAYIVENDVLLAAVSKKVKEANNVHVLYESKVISYELPKKESSELIHLKLENGSLYSCALLIGADGANSEVRKAMGVQNLSWNYNQMGIVATLHLSEPTENVVAWQRFLPTGPIALLPLTDNMSSLVWSTSKEHAHKLLSLSDECFVDAVNDALWKQYPRDSIVDTATKYLNAALEFITLSSNAVRQLQPSISFVENKSRAAFPLGFGHSTKYVAKRVALVGDAAHRVHPLAGQGVNLGFGDVQCLVEKVEEAVSEGKNVGSLSHLLEYETLRQRHNVPTMLAIDSLQKLYGTSFIPVVVLRSLGLQLVHAFHPVKKAIMNHAAA